jgi:hypothetical protein
MLHLTISRSTSSEPAPERRAFGVLRSASTASFGSPSQRRAEHASPSAFLPGVLDLLVANVIIPKEDGGVEVYPEDTGASTCAGFMTLRTTTGPG